MPASDASRFLRRIDEQTWEIPADARADMRVAARVFGDDELIAALAGDRSLEQLMNVATLPGIVGFAVAMPDVHQGYGFPVGAVCATALPDGAVSPGGVGYDINCGVRLLAAELSAAELGGRIEPLMSELQRAIPAGTGRGGRLTVDGPALDAILSIGAREVIDRFGYGDEDDLAFTESEGCLPGADPTEVSAKAKTRGREQLGTLGAGNHFVELQKVEVVADATAAHALGLREGQLTVLIHTGSRGLGHQVCSDFLGVMEAYVARERISLPDRQLAFAPASTSEGRRYLAAMAGAANFAWANRQVIAHRVRQSMAAVVGPSRAAQVRQVYDVAHNVAKEESHGGSAVLVQRKGATRAFGPARAGEYPDRYATVGQPVFIPGSMGTASWVMVGRDRSDELSFASACHGAGRRLSRTQARRLVNVKALRDELRSAGVVVRGGSSAGLAEEAPIAYKDVDRVVDIVANAGIARKVARLVPIGVVKG